MNPIVTLRLILVLFSFLNTCTFSYAQINTENEQKDIEWVELEPASDPTGVFKENKTYAIIPKQLDKFPEGTQLHKSFVLEKQEYLLGEPIMIELRTWLEGPGEWEELHWVGDSHDFVFLMQHEDGEWVQHQIIREPMDRGGSFDRVTQHNAHQRWVLLQFAQAIKRPGKYRLYCFYRLFGWGNEVKVPYFIRGTPLALYAYFPKELQEYYIGLDPTMDKLGKRDEVWLQFSHAWKMKDTLRRAEVYAEFTINIREGNKAENEDMVRKTIESLGKDVRSQQLRSNLTLIQQEHFLRSIPEIYTESYTYGNYLEGLRGHPSPVATEMLFGFQAGKHIVNSFRTTKNEQMVKNVKYLSEHGDEPVRTQAKEWLNNREAYFKQDSIDASVLE
jgi:hypothetical protein